MKTICLVLCLAVLAALSCSSVYGAAIYANDDTYTYQSSPNSNYDKQGLIVKVSPTRYGWIEFTIGSTAVPTATLKMYNRDGNTSNQNIELRAAQYNFNEATLTWNTQPNADGWTLLGYWHVTTPTSWWTLNITNFYNNNLGKTITIRLKPVSGSGDSAHFEDRENSRGSGNRPFIEYPDCVPPSITSHPVSQVKCAGEAVTFSVTASGTTPSYQWRKNGSNISGANSASYTISSVSEADVASYDCYVSNACGNATSNAATLTVNPVSAAPSDPDATGITASSIIWSWQDNSDDETGFKVYVDEGAGPPTTLRTTTEPDVTSWESTGLSANTRYAFQVASTNDLCESARTANLVKYTLVLAPVFGSSGDCAVDCDKGPGSTSLWYAGEEAITFAAVNGIGEGADKASKYLYVWNGSPDEPVWAGASEWTNGVLVKNEASGGSYYLHLRACNGDGVVNENTLTLGPYQVDSTAPSTPVVTDEGSYTTSTTSLSASWISVDEESGIAEYQYAISVSEAEAGIIDGGEWLSAGMSEEATRMGLSLIYGQLYYVLVKARNGAGMWSEIGASDGILVVENIPDTEPLGMSNLSVGGGDWNYDSATGAGQKGIAEAVGLSNIGALVRVWGAFTYLDAGTFTIDDGSGVVIRCEVPATVELDPAWEYVIVTGISSCYKENDDVHRLILVRDQEDIQPIAQ